MTELEELRALVRALADALDSWADAKSDPALDALLARARAVTAPARGGEG